MAGKRAATRALLDGASERLVFGGQSGLIAGIDEAGRGPLAGPVVAAAVILDPDHVPQGLADSKLLSRAARIALYDIILAKAQAVSIGMASVQEIDALNIRQATHLAMRRCAEALALTPQMVLVDGHETAGLDASSFGWNVAPIIKGDGKHASIAAASIIAKVTRDRLMARLDQHEPRYGFGAHQGYGTPFHKAAIEAFGPTTFHRFTFAPVKGRFER